MGESLRQHSGYNWSAAQNEKGSQASRRNYEACAICEMLIQQKRRPMTSTVHRSNAGCGNAGTRGGLALVILALGVVATRPAQAQTYMKLYDFMRGMDGGVPIAGVVRDSAGNLYGTTGEGGDLSCNSPSGCGTVFKIDKTGKETVLYAFTGGTDGASPYGGLVLAGGYLYGTTFWGGASGAGVVYKLPTSGSGETVLYSFKGGADGGHPYAGVIRDTLGNLYGTTVGGGSGSGVVFKLDTTNTESVLYSFAGYPTDGAYPQAGLVRDTTGNLYGATVYGGAFGDGVVFRVNTSNTETVVYAFTGGVDGGNPYAPLVLNAGSLNGTAQMGGSFACILDGCGVVFKVPALKKETVLHSFTGGADGNAPVSGLVRDSSSSLYGTTPSGGAANAGVIFKLDTTNTLTVLHSFSGADGGTPSGVLVRDSAGNLYGTTQSGGAFGYGVVYMLTP